MALLKVNLQDVSIEGPPQLDPGKYTLESVKVTVDTNDDGVGRIRVAFQPADRDENDTRQVTKTFVLSDKAIVFFKRWLAAAKSPLADADELANR